MKIRNCTPAPGTADIDTGWQPAGAACHPFQVTNSTFTPSTPTAPKNIIPENETRFWPFAHSDSRDASTYQQVKFAQEQAQAPLEFRQVTDAAHTTKPRSRLRRFIHHLFHPGKFLALRKAENAVENIKLMLADPEVFMKEGSYDALNEALLGEAAKFLSAVKTLQPETEVYDTSQDRVLNELLMKTFPMVMLLNPELTGKWHTLLPDFADLAQDFRLRVTPCTDLAIAFENEVTKYPEKHLFECVPDWSTRFDEKATTARENAHRGLLPRLEEYQSKAKQYLQDMDPVVTRL